ncbi:MAG TPA: DMT family transporter [Candidatus Cybelea sp.]|nr:DMT family transporter [Candidatus Cybelea sp.]
MPQAGTSAAAHAEHRLRAAAALVGGIFVFSLQDVILKYAAGTYPLTEAVAIRSAAGIIILFAVLQYRGHLRQILSRRSGLLALRGLILIFAYGTYYLAFPAMKLAEVVTLFFVAPIFITALAYPLLGEKVSLVRWLAVLAGFGGVIVTYLPQLGLVGAADGFTLDWALLLPVVAALAYGLAQLMARRLGRTETATVMGFYQNLVFLVGSLVLALLFELGGFAHPGMHPSLAFLVRGWIFGNWHDLVLLAVCGPISAFGTVLLSHAYRLAEANFVASFEYTGLIWATLSGFLFWGEVPDLYMIAGAALIVGAGLYMLFVGRREQM